MKNKNMSEIMQVLHEDMKDMHQSGIISDARMREFDELCLASPKSKKISTPVYDNSLNIKQVMRHKY